ncbi:hypothetical protein ACU4GD_28300 [Cupriavidus basilensis]
MAVLDYAKKRQKMGAGGVTRRDGVHVPGWRAGDGPLALEAATSAQPNRLIGARIFDTSV